MESSKLTGGIEECNSSESGWTMYIASPTPDEDNDNDDSSTNNDDYDDDDGDDNNSHNGCGEDDESMASDASSGPSDRRHSYPKADESNGMGQSEHKNEDEDDDNEFARQFMCKEVHRKAENKRGERKDSTGEKRQAPHLNK